MDEIACFDKDRRRTVSSLRPTGSLALDLLLDLPVAYAHEHTVLFSPLFFSYYSHSLVHGQQERKLLG